MVMVRIVTPEISRSHGLGVTPVSRSGRSPWAGSSNDQKHPRKKPQKTNLSRLGPHFAFIGESLRR